MRSASGASQAAVARTCSRPSSLRPGLSPPSPPENRFADVCGVTPCRTRTSVVGRGRRLAPSRATAPPGPGAGSSISSISDGSSAVPGALTPLRLPSSASLASRSAWLFCSRGTQVYVVPNGARLVASAASGFMSGCLIFQRPDICSTTSLESIRTSISACGANCSASRRPPISPLYSATLLVATPIVDPSSAITSPVSASFSTAPYAAGPGLPREPPSASISTLRWRKGSLTGPILRCAPGSAGTPRSAPPRPRAAPGSRRSRARPG